PRPAFPTRRSSDLSGRSTTSPPARTCWSARTATSPASPGELPVRRRASPTGRRETPSACLSGLLTAGREDELADPLRVGLALGGLHDRADDGARRLDLAAADLVRHVRLGRQRLVDRLLQGRVVGDDLQAPGRHDLVRLTL